MIEKYLINTRKSIFEVCRELDYNYPYESEINLIACSSCGLWLKRMQKDQDGLPICATCIDEYGT